MSGSLILDDVSSALADAIRSGVRRDVTVYPNDPGLLQYPCVIINPDDPYVVFHGTMGRWGQCDINYTVDVHVVADRLSAQAALDDFCSAGPLAESSIFSAIERLDPATNSLDRTLGGTVDDCVVKRVSAPREIRSDADGTVEMVATFTVFVTKLVTGS